MKSLRMRAILKSCGYNNRTKLNTDTVYENQSGDMIYLVLEKDLYNFNCKFKSKDIARKVLFNQIFKSE